MDRLEIPFGPIAPEKFAAIRTQLRMLLSAPAEVIPDTHKELCDALSGAVWNYKLYPWLDTHGYEVVHEQDRLGYRYFVIRPQTWTGASAVSDKIRDAIDRQVLNSLLGRDVP
jgi:hypothetical protein